MKIWPSLLLIFCACVYAANFPSGLGRNKSAMGDVTGMEPKARNALIDAAAFRDVTEPLDKRRLYAGLKAVKPELPFKTRGAKEIELYTRLWPSVVLVITHR